LAINLIFAGNSQNMSETRERYVNPFTDFGFKKLFGEEPNKDLLLDFLNELLREQEGEIKDLTYLKNEHLGAGDTDRKAIFDLYCENERGEKFIVELQKSKQNFFKDRALYYSTFPIQEQAKRADWNYELKAVYTDRLRERIFERLFEVAEVAKFTREELLSYEDSLKYYRDLKNSLDTAFEEGKIEGKIEVIKSGIKSGMDVSTLAKLTGLTEDEINRIMREW
jgi:hypothetical protein